MINTQCPDFYRIKEARNLSFECLQCGECCSYLGTVLTIEEKIGDTEFIICNQYTGERKRVRIDPDKLHLYPDRSIFEELPEACPFLRPDPENDRICCTIHETRTDMCRSYGCWRLLIMNSKGKPVGRISGPRILRTKDEGLMRVWEEKVIPLDPSDQDEWDRRMKAALSGEGFSVRE